MRLIDLDETIELLRGKCVAKYPATFSNGLFAAADELSKLPEVDAVPWFGARIASTGIISKMASGIAQTKDSTSKDTLIRV